MAAAKSRRVFSGSDWVEWANVTALELFGMTWTDFERAYADGTLGESGSARDLASIGALIKRVCAQRRDGVAG